MRIKFFERYTSCVNSSYMDYDADDRIFTGCFYKLDKPKFKKVNISEYRK